MKHRSVIAFILLAAALFAAPQISHDILSLKSAVVARVRGEVMRAFLSLGGRDGGGEWAGRRAGVPAPADARASDASQKSAACRKQETDEARRHADYVAARFAVRKVEWQASGDSLLRKLHAVLPASYEFHVGGDGRRGKVLKLRRGGVGRSVATP